MSVVMRRFRRSVTPALYKMHLWLGLLLTAPLALASLTGGLLLFRSDIIRATVPGADNTTQAIAPAQLGADVERVEQIFGASLRSMRFADDHVGLHEIWLADGRGAFFDPHAQRIVRQWDRASAPLDVIFDLHHELLAGESGRAIMGVIALLASAHLLGGVWLWQRQPRAFRGVMWPPPGRAGLLAAHRDLALVIAAPALIILLSGAVLGLPQASRTFLNAVAPGDEAAIATPSARSGDVDWQVAVPQSVARFPDATPRLVVWPTTPEAPAVVRLRQPAEWHANGRTVAYVDPASSRVLATSDALAASLGTRIANAAYPLHAATIARPWLRWAALLVAASTLLLVIYGFAAWVRRTAVRHFP